MVSGESVTGALPYQPCSHICRLFAREDSKHVVQIVGLRELQVDTVQLLLEVILPPLLSHQSSQSTGKDFILLSSKYDGLRFRQWAVTNMPLHTYEIWTLPWRMAPFTAMLSQHLGSGRWSMQESLMHERTLWGQFQRLLLCIFMVVGSNKGFWK